MSDKNKGGKPTPAAETQPQAAAQVVNPPVEEEAVPDEKDQAELAAARVADEQAQATAAQPAPEPAPEPEAPEVVAVRQAFKTFEDGIAQRELQIEANSQKVTMLQEQVEKENEALTEEIDNLRNTLRTKFGGLFGQAARHARRRPRSRPATAMPRSPQPSPPAATAAGPVPTTAKATARAT